MKLSLLSVVPKRTMYTGGRTAATETVAPLTRDEIEQLLRPCEVYFIICVARPSSGYTRL